MLKCQLIFSYLSQIHIRRRCSGNHLRMSEVAVSEVRRLSTISEQEVDGEAEPLSLVSSVDGEWTGSSSSLCSRANKPIVESSAFTSCESCQTDTSDDCVTILLACLYCRFCEILSMLPNTCERAFGRCFPSYRYYNTSDDQPKGKDWCSCNLDCDCSCMNSCQETSELLELAMEISEVCYR